MVPRHQSTTGVQHFNKLLTNHIYSFKQMPGTLHKNALSSLTSPMSGIPLSSLFLYELHVPVAEEMTRLLYMHVTLCLHFADKNIKAGLVQELTKCHTAGSGRTET